MKVKRIKPSFWTNLYLPSIFQGMSLTWRHIFRKKDTIQYPEQKHEFGERYRGVPALVKDQDGREKCVGCYMCQWVCPPRAITITAAEYPADHEGHHIEKYPEQFDINMLRCIYCGLCEEACPEEAIFMSKTYVVTGQSRELMIFNKEKLYEIGGVRQDDVKKWSEERKGPRDRSTVPGTRSPLRRPAHTDPMFHRVGIAVALALGLSALAFPNATALSGRVVDEAEVPVVQGRVCYIVGTAEQVCSELDEDGRFSLPGSQLDRMRIVAEGFLPRVVATVQQEEPWVLEPAAILRVRLRDERSGEAVGDGEVEVVYASGRRRGPFPANRAGVRVRTMTPGEVQLFASAKGYRASVPVERTLVAGEQLEIVIDLVPADEPSGESAPAE